MKSHLSSAFGKLGVSSRSEAAALILDPERGRGLGIGKVPIASRRSGRQPSGAQLRSRGRAPFVHVESEFHRVRSCRPGFVATARLAREKPARERFSDDDGAARTGSAVDLDWSQSVVMSVIDCP